MTEVDSLCADPKDYEIYFAQILERKKAKKRGDDDDEERSAIDEAFDRAAAAVEVIEDFDPSSYEREYPLWYEILMKFSLLFYGFGSKMDLLHDFGVRFLGQFGYVVEIDAFSGQPRMLQSAINSVSELMGSGSSSMASLISALQFQHKKAFFIIHSLDSEFINDIDTQNALVAAAQSGCVHVIVSMDRTPYLRMSFYTMMQFHTIPICTNRPYVQEIGFTGTAKSGATLDSIDRFVGVLRTLTLTANGIFKVLLKHQLKTGDGMARLEWADKATSELCVRMQTTFPMQVNEFLDHKLIAEKKDTVCSIPLTHVQLQALMTKLEAEER